MIASLMGTPYQPDTTSAILFLEDVHEEPYRIDRMLTTLALGGMFDHLAGILFGRCSDCGVKGPSFSLEEILRDRFGRLPPCHLRPLFRPHRAEAGDPDRRDGTVDADAGRVTIDKAAVSSMGSRSRGYEVTKGFGNLEKPRHLETTQPRNLETSKPRNLETSKPRNLETNPDVYTSVTTLPQPRYEFPSVGMIRPHSSQLTKEKKCARLPCTTALVLFAVPLSSTATAQTADEIVGKYVKAIKDGQDHALKTIQRSGKFTGGGGFEARLTQENVRPWSGKTSSSRGWTPSPRTTARAGGRSTRSRKERS